MPDLFLFGAGASVDAGVPASFKMTEKIAEKFRRAQRQWKHECIHAVHFVIGGLLFEQGIRGNDPLRGGVDVERLFATMRSLVNRTQLESSAFVSAWHPRIEELERAAPGIFHEVNDRMLQYLRQLIWRPEDSSVGYLQPLEHFYRRRRRLVIATLNYDNVLDLFARSHIGEECDDGLEHWKRTGSFDFSGDGIKILKLHGSLDWEYEQPAASDEPVLMRRTIQRVKTHHVSSRKNMQPAVIFGEGNKLTAQGPFLELFREFKQALRESRHLVVLGYSFRDDHINECIRDWLLGDTAIRLTVISQSFGRDMSPFARELIQGERTRVHCIRHHSPDGLRKLAQGLGIPC